MTTERRSGPGRRNDDKDRCANCEFFWSEQERKNEERRGESKELDGKMDTMQACLTQVKTKIDAIPEIKDVIKGLVSWKYFYAFSALILGFSTWVAIDHLDFKDDARKIMSTNTVKIDHAIQMQKVSWENQQTFMRSMGLEAKPLPVAPELPPSKIK